MHHHVSMKNLREGEEVDTVIRRHWIVFLAIAAYVLGGIILTFIIYGLFGLGVFVNLSMIIFWMFYSLFLYINWLNFELDLFIITNKRILCVEQKSFLNRSVAECALDKMQDASYDTKGLLSNIFNFGTMTLTTAGSSKNFDMTYCPSPQSNCRHVNNLAHDYRESYMSGGTPAVEKNTEK